jgi:LPS-assembly lipoprotein
MKQFICLFALLILAACGFAPVYGTHGASENAASQLAQIDIHNIPNQEGQYLRNALIDRFYTKGRPAADPAYNLHIQSLVETLSDLDITKSSDATRGQLRLATRMVLTEKATSKTLVARDLHSVTSYNILSSEFSTRISEENARQNALDDLARQIELQLGLYFNR